MADPTTLGTTVDHTFRVAYQPTAPRTTDADKCIVTCKPLDANGDPTGSNIDLATGDPDVEMQQYHPGWFQFATSIKPLTRGSSYRASYVITVGGTDQDPITQDFVARSDLTSSNDQPQGWHTYTTARLRNIVRAALGLATGTTGVNAGEPGVQNSLEIVNDALEELYSAHDWTWKRGDRLYVPFVPGIYKYTLGQMFGRLRKIVKPANLTHRFIREPFEDLVRRQEQDVSSPSTVTWYDITWDPPNDQTTRGQYVAYVWPTPQTYEQTGMVVHFDRIAPKLCEDADLAPVPQGFQSLMIAAIRCRAFESENDAQAEVERVKFERLMARMIREDGTRDEPDLGPMARSDTYDPWDPMNAIDPEATMTN